MVRLNCLGLSLEELKNIPGLPLPNISLRAIKLFNVPRSEVVRVANLRERLQSNRVVEKGDLNGLDAVLGFKFSAVKKA